MNFSQFIATRRAVADLGAAINAPEFFNDETVPGFVYEGDCYIEGDDANGYTLTLHNEGWTAATVAELEPRLYAWQAGEFPDDENAADGFAADLACRFVDMLAAYMGPDKFAAMRAANAAETNAAVCHSHDYADANEILAEAFEGLANREPCLMDDVDDDAARSGDPDELQKQRDAEDDADAMARAWDIARPMLGRC